MAQSGTLRFSQGRLTNNAKINANAGATNHFAGTLVSTEGSRLAGDGGWNRIIDAPWLAHGKSSGSMVGLGGPNGNLTVSPGAELQLDDLFRWTGGSISGTPNSTRVVVNALQSELSGSGPRTITGAVLENQGECTWSGPASIVLGNGATLSNSGTFRIENDSECSGGGLFLNQGVVQKTIGNTNDFTTFSADFNNEGTLLVAQGNVGLSRGTSRGRGGRNNDVLCVWGPDWDRARRNTSSS